MEQRKLKQLLSEMSLREKIGQMIQLTGIYFDDDAVLTGEVGEDQPTSVGDSVCWFCTRYDRGRKAQGNSEKICGSASASYSIAVYGRCHTWVQDYSSDSFGTGLFVSSGTG